MAQNHYGQRGAWRGRSEGAKRGPDEPNFGGEGRVFGEPGMAQREGQYSGFGLHGQQDLRHQDRAFEGRHRGRGPKGYRRSDERIREDVGDRLTLDPLLDASDIEIEVADGEVTLSGTVETRADKHRAEMLTESCSGVQHVQNNLRARSR